MQCAIANHAMAYSLGNQSETTSHQKLAMPEIAQRVLSIQVVAKYHNRKARSAKNITTGQP